MFIICRRKAFFFFNKTLTFFCVDGYKIIALTFPPDCPPIHDAVDGGQMTLATLSPDATDETHYRFDCVWLIKFPQFRHTFDTQVYVHVEAADLIDGELLQDYSIFCPTCIQSCKRYKVNCYKNNNSLAFSLVLKGVLSKILQKPFIS